MYKDRYKFNTRTYIYFFLFIRTKLNVHYKQYNYFVFCFYTREISIILLPFYLDIILLHVLHYIGIVINQ